MVVPAVVYIRVVLREPPVKYVRLDAHLWRGLAYGAAAGLLPAGQLIYRALHAGKFPVIPHSADLWLNAIIAAPVAQEILIRGLLFRELSRIATPLKGAVISSILFALIHLPFWYFAGRKSGGDLARSLLLIGGIGMICCLVATRARTLVAPITFHFLNNLMTSCVV